MLAKRKCIDVEMTHIKDARHANFISRHVREKRKYEAEDEARFRKVFWCKKSSKFGSKMECIVFHWNFYHGLCLLEKSGFSLEVENYSFS